MANWRISPPSIPDQRSQRSPAQSCRAPDRQPALSCPAWLESQNAKWSVDLRDEFVGFGRDQGEGLSRRVPSGRRQRSGFDGGDGEDALDGLGCFYLLC